MNKSNHKKVKKAAKRSRIALNAFSAIAIATPVIKKYGKTGLNLAKNHDILSKTAYNFESERIAIIHSYGACIINVDNKMIILAHIGRILWINQIIKRNTNTTTNDF